MNENLTELVFILDRSGSMSGLEEDTIGGFNSFIEKQKNEKGGCLVSTVLFNQSSKVVHDRVDLKEIEKMTRNDYFASGTTALIDALGDAIRHIRTVHRYIRKEDVPVKTAFIIITDGMENASRRYSSDEVKKMVKEQKAKGWDFLFLAANIDAVETAKSYGIEEEYSVDFHNDAKGVAKNFETLSETVACYRKKRSFAKDWAAGIKDDFKERGN